MPFIVIKGCFQVAQDVNIGCMKKRKRKKKELKRKRIGGTHIAKFVRTSCAYKWLQSKLISWNYL